MYNFTKLHLDDAVEFIQKGLQTVDSAEEYAKLKTSQLYEVFNGEEIYAVLCIKDRDVMGMLQPFAVMTEEYKTVISQNIWNCFVQRHSVLSLPEVATKIWTPVFKAIQQFIENCYDKSVTLKELDCYLKDILSDNLEQEIQTLINGCNLCLDKTVSTTWVYQFVMSVSDYRDVCKAQSTAQLILNVKDTLMLSGNFKELNEFILQVTIAD